MTFGGGAITTIMGGIAAEATGGDFAEGALTAMVVFLYNDIADYVARARRRDGLQQAAELRAVQRARSYKEITQGRKKIDALFTNGANVVMVVSGTGAVYYAVRATISGRKYIVAYRAVSYAEAKDIIKHGFRANPSGSMGAKWFSETESGAKKFMEYYDDLDTIVRAKIPKSTYNSSYRVSDIDLTGPGFAVPENLLYTIKY